MREFWIHDARRLDEMSGLVAAEFEVRFDRDSENVYEWYEGVSDAEGLTFNISRPHASGRSQSLTPTRISVRGPGYTEATILSIGRRLARCLTCQVSFGNVTSLPNDDFHFEELEAFRPTESDLAALLVRSFPPSLRLDAQDAIASLPVGAHPPSPDSIGPVVLEGVPLHIPFRVYFAESVAELASAQVTLIRDCLQTRHHDGRVRERALRRIIPHREPWVVPFTVQLVGEYVAEIIDIVDRELTLEHAPVYGGVLARNKAFLALTRERAFSYWNCYYRSRVPHVRDYVGMRVIDRLVAWSSRGA